MLQNCWNLALCRIISSNNIWFLLASGLKAIHYPLVTYQKLDCDPLVGPHPLFGNHVIAWLLLRQALNNRGDGWWRLLPRRGATQGSHPLPQPHRYPWSLRGRFWWGKDCSCSTALKWRNKYSLDLRSLHDCSPHTAQCSSCPTDMTPLAL